MDPSREIIHSSETNISLQYRYRNYYIPWKTPCRAARKKRPKQSKRFSPCTVSIYFTMRVTQNGFVRFAIPTRIHKYIHMHYTVRIQDLIDVQRAHLINR